MHNIQLYALLCFFSAGYCAKLYDAQTGFPGCFKLEKDILLAGSIKKNQGICRPLESAFRFKTYPDCFDGFIHGKDRKGQIGFLA